MSLKRGYSIWRYLNFMQKGQWPTLINIFALYCYSGPSWVALAQNCSEDMFWNSPWPSVVNSFFSFQWKVLSWPPLHSRPPGMPCARPVDGGRVSCSPPGCLSPGMGSAEGERSTPAFMCTPAFTFTPAFIRTLSLVSLLREPEKAGGGRGEKNLLVLTNYHSLLSKGKGDRTPILSCYP